MNKTNWERESVSKDRYIYSMGNLCIFLKVRLCLLGGHECGNMTQDQLREEERK